MSQIPAGISQIDWQNYQARLAAYQAQQQQQQSGGITNLLAQLFADNSTKDRQAHQDNLDRYYDTLKLLGIDRNANLADVAGVGASRVEDTNRAFNQLAGKQTVDAANRGLSGTSFTQAQQRDTERQRQAALTNVNDSLLQNRINTRQSSVAPIAGVMERRTDGYPNTDGLDQLLQQYMQAGGGGTGPLGNLSQLLPGLIGGGTGSTGAPNAPPRQPSYVSLSSAGPASTQVTTGNPPAAASAPAPTAFGQSVIGYNPPPLLQASGPTSYQDVARWADNPNNPNAPGNQQRDMAQQGYTYSGNNTYARAGSGQYGGSHSFDGKLPDQYVVGPPPAGTNIQQGQASYLQSPNQGYGADPFISGLLSRLIGNYGGGYGTGYNPNSQPQTSATIPAPGSSPFANNRPGALNPMFGPPAFAAGRQGPPTNALVTPPSYPRLPQNFLV